MTNDTEIDVTNPDELLEISENASWKDKEVWRYVFETSIANLLREREEFEEILLNTPKDTPPEMVPDVSAVFERIDDLVERFRTALKELNDA